MENRRYIGVLLADTLFEDVDTYMIRLLKKVPEYEELKKKRKELQYPFINSLYNFYESTNLTEEQDKRLRDEMEWLLVFRQYEHREHFWIGQQNVNKKMAGGICSAKNFGQNR